MSASPIITSILTTPHIAPPGQQATLSLGLVIDDAQVYWTTCALTAVSPLNDLTPITVRIPATAESAAATINRLVTPVLIGKPLIAVLDHITVISQLTETITFSKQLPPDPAASTAVSRRGLFTGQFLNPQPPSSQKITVEQEQPLHPALRDALTHLLLTAAAAQRRQTIAEMVAQYYVGERPSSSVPLHLDLDNSSTARLALTPQITSLGYTTTRAEPKAALGANGEILQSQVRSLATWLDDNQYTNRTLHLRLGGGYGALYDNNLGRILGTIFGQVQAAKPYLVRIEDPFILDSCEAQIARFRQLQDFVRIRRLNVELAAHAWVDSVAAVEAFAAAGVVQMLHVDADQFVSLPAALEAVVAARKYDVQVMWGMNGRMPRLTAHVSLALRPDLVMAGAAEAAAQLQNEMQRTLAWLAYQPA